MSLTNARHSFLQVSYLALWEGLTNNNRIVLGRDVLEVSSIQSINILNIVTILMG